MPIYIFELWESILAVSVRAFRVGGVSSDMQIPDTTDTHTEVVVGFKEFVARSKLTIEDKFKVAEGEIKWVSRIAPGWR